MPEQPGPVVLAGSGETSASGQKVFDRLLRGLRSPVRAAIVEAPAGFELNSGQVAGRIGEFLCRAPAAGQLDLADGRGLSAAGLGIDPGQRCDSCRGRLRLTGVPDLQGG